MSETKAILLDEYAASLGMSPAQAKSAKASLKRGRHWIVGRYNKSFLTKAGQEALRQLAAPVEVQEPEIVVGVESEQDEKHEKAPQEVQNEPALARMLRESDTATVLVTRMPNRRLLKVNHHGEEKICICKDSHYFVPGMVIPVRQDGENLVAKFQPRRLGKF